MEVSLKDESGISPSSLLEKSVALTNEIQVKAEVPALDVLKDAAPDLTPVPEGEILKTGEPAVPVQEKIVNAVNSAVEAVVDGVKGLVDAVKTKVDDPKVNQEAPKSPDIQPTQPSEQIASPPSIQIDSPVVQNNPIPPFDIVQSELVDSMKNESSGIAVVYTGTNPQLTQGSVLNISSEPGASEALPQEVPLVENKVKLAELHAVGQVDSPGEQSVATEDSVPVLEPVVAFEKSESTESVAPAKEELPPVPELPTGSSPVPLLDQTSAMPKAEESLRESSEYIAEAVKVEQLSPTVRLIQDKFLVEKVQETPAAAEDKPKVEAPAEAIETKTPAETKTEAIAAAVEAAVEKVATPVVESAEKAATPVVEAVQKAASPVVEAVKAAISEPTPEVTVTPAAEPPKTEDLPPPLPASPPPEEKPAPTVATSPVPSLDAVVGQAGDAFSKVEEAVKEEITAIQEKIAEIPEKVESTVEEVPERTTQVISDAVEKVTQATEGVVEKVSQNATDISATVEESVTKPAEEITDKEEEQGAGESLADVPKDLVEEVAAMTVEDAAPDSSATDCGSDNAPVNADGGGSDE